VAVENADDLAGMFAADDFAVSASYAPAAGGGGSTVSIILDRPVETLELGSLGINADTRVFVVRRSEVAEPVRGDLVTAEGEVLVVQSATLDVSRSVWTVEASVSA